MSLSGNLKGLLTSAGLVILGRVVGSITIVGERIVIGRLLTPAAYGEVSIGLALLSFSSTAALVGMSIGVPRYVSRFEDEADRRGVWVGGLALSGCLGVVVSAGLYVNVGTLSRTLLEQADSPRLLGLFALALPFIVGLRIGTGTIRGLENTRYKILAQDLVYPVVRLGLLVVLLVAGFGIVAAGYAYVLAAVAAFVVSHLLLHRLMSLVGPFRLHLRQVLRFSAPVVLAGFLTTLLTWTDTIMLGYFRESFEVGQYSAAYTVGGALLIVLSGFGFLYLPLASRLDADDEHGEIDRIYATTTKWVYVVTFPAFLVFLVFPGDVLHIFFGPRYRQAALGLTILSVGFFSNAIGGRNRETLSALGLTRYLVVVNGSAFALNFLLNLLLIPVLGFVGAAVASSISIIAQNTVACGILKLKYDITPFSRWSVRTYVFLPVLLVPPAYLVSPLISVSVLSLFPVLVLVGLVTLGVVATVGGLQSEDRIVVEVVEERIGVRIPLVRQYIPAR